MPSTRCPDDIDLDRMPRAWIPRRWWVTWYDRHGELDSTYVDAEDEDEACSMAMEERDLPGFYRYGRSMKAFTEQREAERASPPGAAGRWGDGQE